MKPLVFIAGPYTHPDPGENVHLAIKLGMMMIDEGIVTPVIPHLCHQMHLVDPRPYEYWCNYDLELLANCHAVFRMEGNSNGANVEVNAAEDRGIPVFYYRDTLYTWAIQEWTP